jgi:phage gp36-like protein
MYCTSDDIIDLYGYDLLVRIADHDKDGAPDPDKVEKGLIGAAEICDAYLSAQYTVPVVPAPGIVRTCAINIAVYLIAMDRVRRTEEMRLRYEDALKLLERISTGRIGLGLPPGDGNGDGNETNPNARRKGRSMNTARA